MTREELDSVDIEKVDIKTLRKTISGYREVLMYAEFELKILKGEITITEIICTMDNSRIKELLNDKKHH